MSYLIDSHCHLHDLEYYEGEKEAVLRRARDDDVQKIITIGTDPKDSLDAQKFALAHEDVFYTWGVHPEYAGKVKDFELPKNREKLVAIGEVGLDYHFGDENKSEQIALLEKVLQMAQDSKMPVAFHVRDAFVDFWPVVDNFKLSGAVMHSFSDNAENLEKSLERGFYIGVNGLATFAKLPIAPIEKILLETDAPFLTPVPFRGKVNEPCYVRCVAEWLAKEKSLSFDEVSYMTTKNTETLFQI